MEMEAWHPKALAKVMPDTFIEVLRVPPPASWRRKHEIPTSALTRPSRACSRSTSPTGGERGLAAEASVGSAVIVVVEPAGQGSLAFVAVAVDGGVGPAGEQGADEPFDSPMSSVERWCCLGPGVEAPVDDVGEVAFEGSAGFARCFPLGDLAGEVGARGWVVAGLHDGDAVEGGVELAVAAAVEAVAACGLA
jgi:hypothetical protein